MVASAAREIPDREVVFVGMRLPLIAFVVAKHTACAERSGVVREWRDPRDTGGGTDLHPWQPGTQHPGYVQCLDMLSVMSLLQSGSMDFGIPGPKSGQGRSVRKLEFSKGETVARSPRLRFGAGALVEWPSRSASRFGWRVRHCITCETFCCAAGTFQAAAAGTSVVCHQSGRWRRCGVAPARRSAARRAQRSDHHQGGAAVWGRRRGAAGVPLHPGVVMIEDVVASTGWKLRVLTSDVRRRLRRARRDPRPIREYDKAGGLDELKEVGYGFARCDFVLQKADGLDTNASGAHHPGKPAGERDGDDTDDGGVAGRDGADGSGGRHSGRGVLAGSDRAFSAGVDVGAHTPDKVRDMLVKMHAVMRALAGTRKVTIAAVRGNCFGGGAELAAMCDLVFTTDTSNWGFPEITLGCFPPVAAVVLSAIVGQKRAADLILTGRRISGEEAMRIGLANEAVPDNELSELVDEAAERLGKLSAASLAMAKKALYTWDAIHFDKGLARAEKIYLEELMKLEDAHEGIKAFMEKRQPVWKGK